MGQMPKILFITMTGLFFTSRALGGILSLRLDYPSIILTPVLPLIGSSSYLSFQIMYGWDSFWILDVTGAYFLVEAGYRTSMDTSGSDRIQTAQNCEKPPLSNYFTSDRKLFYSTPYSGPDIGVFFGLDF